MMTSVIDALRSDGQEVVAMVAPAIEGQFGKATLPQIKEAIRQLGFKDVYEVALGADMVALSEAEELLERKAEGQPMTSSCCPAFVSLVRKHFPALLPFVSTTVSPMVAAEPVYPQQAARGRDRIHRPLHRQEERGHVPVYPGAGVRLDL